MSKSKEIANINNVSLKIDTNIMSPKMVDVIRSGKYEQAEVREIPRIIQKGERIVELGGGVGFLACVASNLGLTDSIAVYEANPQLIPLIEENKKLNSANFDVFNKVVLPEPEGKTIPFYLRKDFWASSLSPKPWGYKEQIEVPTISFREMLETHNPTMLIVDIEGGELSLFRDIPLTGIKKIYIELHQNVLGRTGMKHIFDFLSAKDFHYDSHHSRGKVVLFSHVLR